MRRTYLSIALIALSLLASAQTEVVTKSTIETFGQNQPVEVAHWSFAIRGGANYFRVGPQRDSRLDAIHFIFGGELEYSVNPFWGLGIDYTHNPFGRPYLYNGAKYTMTGGSNDVILYSALNLSNILSPYRTGEAREISVIGTIGAGFGFFNYKLPEPVMNSSDLATGRNASPVLKVGLNLEYNLDKLIALFGAAQYSYYNRPDIAGISYFRGYTDALQASVGLRFKFGTEGTKQHARNITVADYYPETKLLAEKVGKYDQAIMKAAQDSKAMQQVIDSLRDQLNEKARKDKRQSDSIHQDLRERIERVDADSKKTAAKQSTFEAPISKIATLEDQLKSLESKGGSVNMSFQNINFITGSANLDPKSYGVLDQIVAALKSTNSWNRVTIIGHSDNSGNAALNRALSQSRAYSVKDYLTSKGIDGTKINCLGYGADKPIASNKTAAGKAMNRRVEFEIAK